MILISCPALSFMFEKPAAAWCHVQGFCLMCWLNLWPLQDKPSNQNLICRNKTLLNFHRHNKERTSQRSWLLNSCFCNSNCIKTHLSLSVSIRGGRGKKRKSQSHYFVREAPLHHEGRAISEMSFILLLFFLLFISPPQQNQFSSNSLLLSVSFFTTLHQILNILTFYF